MRNKPAGLALAFMLSTSLIVSAQAEEVVNIYSARHYDSDQLLYDAFAEETGITVNVIEDKDGSLIERIKAEGENSPGDIMFTADAGNLSDAAQHGIFQPVESEVLESRIPENLRDPEGLWFALTKRGRVIMYREADVDVTGLTRYEDLADPKWQGMICIRPSGNVYNQSLVSSLIVADGPEATAEWVQGVVANFAREPEGNDTAQIKAVAAGECDIAVANTYYLARLMRSDDPADVAVAESIGVIMPNQGDRGVHINVSGAGVLLHAPNRDNAVLFLEFLTSDEAQEIFAMANNEWPVVDGLDHAEVLDTLYGEFKEDDVSPAEFGRHRSEALTLMEANGWK
jgi:iron(III) transport system substrate-binding protein